MSFFGKPEIHAVLLTALLAVIGWSFVEWTKSRHPKTIAIGHIAAGGNSRFRWHLVIVFALVIATVSLFGILPDETKLRLLKLLGLH